MKELCQKIHMPAEVTRRLLALEESGFAAPDLTGLTDPAAWKEAHDRLRSALAPDPDGFRELYCMLLCAKNAKAEYSRLGIPETVYYDTMACFSRFVREHMESYGRHGFDRGFWTVRQISCRLLRIGLLEFELVEGAVSLHIPSDAPLDPAAVSASLQAGRALISDTFPSWKDAPMVCHSWLLSPILKEFLPEGSNILRFQNRFRLQILPAPTDSFLLWVFKNPTLPPQELPEDTSLQRKLKAFLLGGGTYPDAKGTLWDES